MVETFETELESDATYDTRARIVASGRFQWSSIDPSSWRGEGLLERFEGVVSGIELAARSAPWSLADGELSLPSVELSTGGTTLELGGTIGGPAPWTWSGRARGTIDGSALAPLLQENGAGLSGAVRIDVTGSSTAEPPIEGTISLTNARLSLREPPAILTGLDVELRIRGDEVELARLAANTGGGTISGEGKLRLDGTTIASADLGLTADAVRLSYPEGLRSLVDGRLRLSGAGDELTLSGDISLDRAVLSRDINLETEVLQSFSRQHRTRRPTTAAGGIRLNVRVRSREGLRVDNNLARLQASASLEARGTLNAPELSGTVTSRPGGEFRLGRNLYRIESGRIDLAGYPSSPPTIDINARTVVADYDVRMSVSGPADNVTTTIAGTSRRNGASISQTDAASLLVTGRTMDKVSGEGRTILGEQLTSFAGSALADLATLGLSEAFPVRVRTGDPGLITGESNPSALFIVEAGVTQDLSVGYGIGLDDPERQIWLVDYYLPKSMRTQLIRQQTDEFTGALSQQLRFGGSQAQFDEGRAAGAVVSGFEAFVATSEPAPFEEESAVAVAASRGLPLRVLARLGAGRVAPGPAALRRLPRSDRRHRRDPARGRGGRTATVRADGKERPVHGPPGRRAGLAPRGAARGRVGRLHDERVPRVRARGGRDPRALSPPALRRRRRRRDRRDGNGDRRHRGRRAGSPREGASGWSSPATTRAGAWSSRPRSRRRRARPSTSSSRRRGRASRRSSSSTPRRAAISRPSRARRRPATTRRRRS